MNEKISSYSSLKKLTGLSLKSLQKFFLNNRTLSSGENFFAEINIFNPANRSLLFAFFLFFAVAICGYLSVMILSVPYRDDWYRYFWNSHVGGSEALRSGTALVEFLFYLSDIVTDAAPFTNILSCAVLAYMACIFLKMLKVGIKDKWKIICFVPIVVNPFLLEVMLFRFDNFFITLSLLIVTIAAYLSIKNDKIHFITQSLLLFLSLFVYQAAISVYLTILVYEFIKKIRLGNKLIATIQQMKYWFYSIIVSALGYMPLLQCLNYYKTEDGSVLVLPYNWENTKMVMNNIFGYFNTLYNDWVHSVIGFILLIIVCIFVVNSLIKTMKITKSIGSVLLVSFCLFVLIICPSGLYICLKYKETALVPPRLLCGAGAFIAIVNYEVYLLLKKTKITDFFIKTILCLTITWNLMFLNSAVNIMRENFKFRSLLEYDIAKDVFELSKTYPEISHFEIVGEVETQATTNFFKLYPIMNKIFPEKFNIFTYYRLGFMHNGLKEELENERSVFFNNPKYHSKQLIKECMSYDLYILDNRILYIVLKKDVDREKRPRFIMKVGRK